MRAKAESILLIRPGDGDLLLRVPCCIIALFPFFFSWKPDRYCRVERAVDNEKQRPKVCANLLFPEQVAERSEDRRFWQAESMSDACRASRK